MDPAWDYETLAAWFSARPREDVPETELLKAFFPDETFSGGIGLSLFQKHFLLYRRLWLFDDELRLATGQRLWIRGIRSTLLDPPLPGHCGWLDPATGCYCGAPGEPCPQHGRPVPEKNSMKSYYLDWKNLSGMTEEGLKALVNGFFQWMANRDDVVRALETLGLPPDASPRAVKTRWRRLSFEHHPDHGGNPERFHRLSEAWSILKDLSKR